MKAHSISDSTSPDAGASPVGASALHAEQSHSQSALSTPVNVLRLPHVCQMTGLGRSMVYQMEAQRRFPHRIKLGVRAVGWIESEVQEWLLQRARQRRDRL